MPHLPLSDIKVRNTTTVESDKTLVDGATRSSKKKVDRRKAPERKEQILDAAEALFVKRGYHGSSLRDISKAAGVQVALTYYHFGSKEDLYRAVIDRRADQNAADLRAALRRVTSGDEPPTIEAVLRAFIEPVVEKLTQGGEGWRNYIRLLAQVAHLPQEESIFVPFDLHYDSVAREFVTQVASLFPEMSEEDVHWGFYFYQAAITHLLNESGLIDRQSQGLCRSSDLDTIVKKITRFFALGFKGISNSNEQAGTNDAADKT